MFLLYTPLITTSPFDNIISAEIINDELYYSIQHLAKTEPIKTILEIGSSNGAGSTKAFVLGMLQNAHHPKLYCIEISKVRFNELKKRYRRYSCIKCYNVSSVPLNSFAKRKEVDCTDWYDQDISYVQSSGIKQNGIELIKKENQIKTFDMVLIDGSEHTAKAELALVYGAKILILDDIKAFKNKANYERLVTDPNYILFKKNTTLRNGYAIFKHKNYL